MRAHIVNGHAFDLLNLLDKLKLQEATTTTKHRIISL